jgi:hypothetical protein
LQVILGNGEQAFAQGVRDHAREQEIALFAEESDLGG